MEVECENGFVLVAKKSANDVLKDLTDCQNRVAALSRRELKLLTNAAADSAQMRRATQKLRPSKATI